MNPHLGILFFSSVKPELPAVGGLKLAASVKRLFYTFEVLHHRIAHGLIVGILVRPRQGFNIAPTNAWMPKLFPNTPVKPTRKLLFFMFQGGCAYHSKHDRVIALPLASDILQVLFVVSSLRFFALSLLGPRQTFVGDVLYALRASSSAKSILMRLAPIGCVLAPWLTIGKGTAWLLWTSVKVGCTFTHVLNLLRSCPAGAIASPRRFRNPAAIPLVSSRKCF